MLHRRALVAALLVATTAAMLPAQAPIRRLTTVEILREHSSFFNLQNVLLRGQFVENGTRIVFRADDRDMDVMLDNVNPADGLVEITAQLFDIGRLEPNDPRLAGYAGGRDPERWPKPGEELVLHVTGVTSVNTATTPSVRALALEPWKFEGQNVTLIGQFRGRNLFGDLPTGPAHSRYDFVLRTADAAVWATGLRPRGRGFDLDVDARVDTNRWLQVTGVVKRERGLVTVQASAITLAQAPSAEPAPQEPAESRAPLAPAAVVFSSPGDQETDVAVNAPVRVQFSRGLDPSTIAASIRVRYVSATKRSSPDFDAIYDLGTRAVQIRFRQPLEPFQTIRIDIMEGMKTFDGAPVTPWSLTFSVGG